MIAAALVLIFQLRIHWGDACGLHVVMETIFGVKLRDVSEHIKCVLCGGYLIDATTITDCLHSCN